MTSQELRDGLADTSTLAGMVRQVSRCLDVAYRSASPEDFPVVLQSLQLTIEMVTNLRQLRRMSFSDDGGILMAIVTEGAPHRPSWADWFRSTQRYICLHLFNRTVRASEDGLDEFLARLQEIQERADTEMGTVDVPATQS